MCEKIVLPAYSMSYNTTPEIQIHHDNNNQIIKSYLEEFMKVNNLGKHDFIIVGSSCASYMDYLILNRVRDIDVLPINNIDISSLIKTKNIDVLSRVDLINEQAENCIEKDGFLFSSKMDILVSSSISILLKQKRRSFSYVRILLDDLNIKSNDFIELLTAQIEKSNLSDKLKKLALKNMVIFKIKLID